MKQNIKSIVRAYLDQKLSEAEVAELDDLLRTDADARQVFLQEANLVAGLEQAACEIGEPVLADRGQNAKKTNRNAVAAAVAALVLLTTGLLLYPRKTDESIATISGLSGPLQFTGNAGEVREDLAVNMRLPGGTIDGLSPDSWFSLTFNDGSSVTISGDSTLVFSALGQKRLHLKSGNLSADVTPQPSGCPMLVHTRSAVLEVVGTSFEVKADVAATALSVTEGEVHVRRLSDDREVAVPAEHQVIAAADQKLEVTQSATKVGIWKSQLELGPDGSFGRWTRVNQHGLLATIPYITEDRKTIFTTGHQVTAADRTQVVTSDKTFVGVRGQMDTPHMLFIGLSLKTSKGDFAGRFQKVLQQEDFLLESSEAGAPLHFNIRVPLQDLELDPSLSAQAHLLPDRPTDLVIEHVWCHSLYDSVGLAVREFEIISAATLDSALKTSSAR